MSSAVERELGQQTVHPVTLPNGASVPMCPRHAEFHMQSERHASGLAYQTGLLDEGERPTTSTVGEATKGTCRECISQQHNARRPEDERYWRHRKTDSTQPKGMSPYAQQPQRFTQTVAPFTPLRQSLNAAGMNPVCDQPECMDRKRFIGGYPDTGHYDDDMNWVPHQFDETNHPSHSERVRLADDRRASDPEHCAKHGETLYHGTTKEAADSISKHGFHLDNTTNGRHSGHGVYLTKSKAEAHEYGSHVVEAHVDTSNFHDNPWYDEDVAHVHPDHISAALESRGHHGHIDPDDGAHIVYNPKHVHVVKVHAPEGKTAAIDYANETPEDKAARRADWKKKKPDVPEVPGAPKGAHTAFRGIHLGGTSTIHGDFDPSDPHQVMAKVLSHTQHFRKMHDWPHDPSDPYAHRQQIFGNHWSTDHETARRFSVRTVENQDRGIPNYNHRPNTKPVHGVVFEARMHEPAEEQDHYRGYGEKEVRIPSRHQVHTLIAHVHTLHPPTGDPNSESMHDSLRRTRDTHVHSFIVPDRHWRTALKVQANSTTADADGHLVNPATGGKDWHHGTPHPFTAFDHEPEHEGDMDDMESDIERHSSKHWNTFLGTHWTSLKDTAHKFAKGLHHNAYTAPKGDGGTVHTAHLGITSPAHFHDEEDMDSDAFDHHWEHGRHDREDPHRYHDEVCDKGDHVSDHGDDDVAEHVRGEYKGGNEARYLQSHPYKEDIAAEFREHLQSKGHDGITYGNSMPDEGPTGHTCAITFDHSQIQNHRTEPGKFGWK